VQQFDGKVVALLPGKPVTYGPFLAEKLDKIGEAVVPVVVTGNSV